MLPFLKWAGGKRWLTKRIADRLPEFRTYHEPFLGGAAVFWSILPREARLSDSNAELIETYLVVRDAPLELRDRLAMHQLEHSDRYYYDVRASDERDSVSRAARFLYLNRTCWNGLYRVNKMGKFNVPKGTKDLIYDPEEDWLALSNALRSAHISCLDFEDAIDAAAAGDFVYADPPYTVKHNMNGFVKYNQDIFSWADQVRLRDAAIRARARGVNISISNADHPSIWDIYADAAEIEVVNRPSVISGLPKGRSRTTEVVAHFWTAR